MTATIGHFDIEGPLDLLNDFYSGVFDWKVNPVNPRYAMVHTGAGGPDGALGLSPGPSRIVLGIVVDDLDATVAAIEEHGGSVLEPVTDNGWVRKARVSDPAGNHLSLLAGG